jgi:hypothetical protein
MAVFMLYTYSISKLDKSTRVRFVYLLKGRREQPGLVEQFKGRFLAPGCFMIPDKHDKDMSKIIQQWKVKSKKLKITIG